MPQNEHDLKQCPFCGCHELLPSKSDSPFDSEEFLHFVYCVRCEAQSGSYKSVDLAVTAWDERVRDE